MTEIDDRDSSRAENAGRGGGARARLREPRRAAGAPRHRHRRDQGQGRGLRGRGAVLGRRHRRHALRALPGARRAARHLRQARGLRGDPPADRGDADGCRCTSPGTRPSPAALRDKAAELGLGFDAMNSNTFSGRARARRSPTSSARSATPTRRVRAQAVEHNLECIEIGQALGSKALTVWIGDGSNFPGQSHFTRAFERYLEAMREIYAGAAGATGGCSPSTRCTSRRSTRRWCRTGAPTT